ncbi:MAG: aldo/keto reductase [Opitutaceae bacterium]|nr:aldo/keto reductase [Opitutaceae bacterium]
MKPHRFGRTGLPVSELCLGTSNFARCANREETFAMLDAFRAAGGNMVQSSGLCPGASLGDGLLGLPEEFLGHWLASRAVPRREIVIATRIALARPVVGGNVTYRELMQGCVHDSLRRIGTDHLDFLVIEWTEAVLPLDESMAVFDAVIRSGAARHLVAAHFPSGRLAGALPTRSPHRAIDGVQLDYSLVYRPLFEASAAKLCRDYNLGFIARSPLAGGHLVAQPPSQLGSFQCRSSNDPDAAAQARLVWPVLSTVARTHGKSPAQVALAWVLAQPAVTSVLISVRFLDQLRDLIAATRITLTPEESRRLRVGTQRRPGDTRGAP